MFKNKYYPAMTLMHDGFMEIGVETTTLQRISSF